VNYKIEKYDFGIDKQRLFETLVPDNDDVDLIEELNGLIALCAQCSGIKVMHKECDIKYIDENTLKIDDTTLSGEKIANSLKSSNKVVLYVATVGCELENLANSREDFFEHHWLNCINEFAMLSAFTKFTKKIQDTLGENKKLINIQPGNTKYWGLEFQPQLFSILGNVKEETGVTLGESLIMTPKKSISGFIAIG
jgi:hypothetical protein